MTWARGLFGAALIVFALYGLKTVVDTVTCPVPPVARKPVPMGNSYEMEVIRLTNIERNKRGLQSLKPSAEIMKFSRNWSRVQANSRMHHSRGSGYGENVAFGQDTPEEVMRAWMTSPGHRRNILNSNYRYIGVGYVVDGRGRPFWTQNFR
jgi:uncharacterized protein YkwD